MTAAIPPACCAGADNGTPPAPPGRIGRACRGGFACADSGADYSGLRAEPVSEFIAISVGEHVAVSNTDADTFTLSKPDADAFALSKPNADAHVDADPNADADADADADPNADWRWFKRRIDQRPGQSAL